MRLSEKINGSLSSLYDNNFKRILNESITSKDFGNITYDNFIKLLSNDFLNKYRISTSEDGTGDFEIFKQDGSSIYGFIYNDTDSNVFELTINNKKLKFNSLEELANYLNNNLNESKELTKNESNVSEDLDKEYDEYLDKMGKKYERFCKNLDIDKEDLDDALYALDELEGEFGDAEGKYQELREFIYNELLESEQLTESKKYNVYINCEQPEGVYNTKLVDTVDSIEKAEDRCRELEAETGCGAHFIEAPASNLEGIFEVWQRFYENGEVTTEMVQRFDNYLDALRFVNGLNQNPDCEAWIKELKESEKLTEGTNQKRIARYREFDNGHVLHSWYEMSDDEAEEKAKQASINDPTDIYYVAYDDIMNSSSDIRWYKGKHYSIDEVNEIRKKEKENIEIKESESPDKQTILSRIFARYPDISEEDEDYLNSLPLDGLINEVLDRGWNDLLDEE